MLLILSNSEDVTASYLQPLLRQHSIEYIRFDTDRALANATVGYRDLKPKLSISGVSVAPQNVSTIWYRRPERIKSPRSEPIDAETNYALDEWSEAFEGFLAHIPIERWMNHPATNAKASHKIEQLSTATSFGFVTPYTLVTQSESELKEFYKFNGGDIIVKPLSCGIIEDKENEKTSLIYTSSVQEIDLANLSDLSECPTLFQQRIHKAYDVRITVVDSALHAIKLKATEANGQQRGDIRRDNMNDVIYEPCVLPFVIEEKIRELVDYYQLRFAAIDMAVTLDGTWVYFEINPNGQWAWLDIFGGSRIADSFIKSFLCE